MAGKSKKTKPKKCINRRNKDTEVSLKSFHSDCLNMIIAATKVAKLFRCTTSVESTFDANVLTSTGYELIKELNKIKVDLDNIAVDAKKIKKSKDHIINVMNQAPIIERYQQWVVNYTNRVAPLLGIIDETCSGKKEVKEDG